MCTKGERWAWNSTLGVPPAAFPRFFLSAFSFSSISIISLSINVIKVLHRLWSSYNYKHIKPTPTKSLLLLLLLLFNVAKCNLGKVNLESMRPAVFSTNMHAGWPQGFALPCADKSAICHLLLLCHHNGLFYIASLANLLPCPSHPCWKSEPSKYCVR